MTIAVVIAAATAFAAQPAIAARGGEPCPTSDKTTGISRAQLQSLLNIGFPMTSDALTAVVPEPPTCWLNAHWAAYRARWDPDALLILLYVDQRSVRGYDFYFIDR
jgi:hypothetical protein